MPKIFFLVFALFLACTVQAADVSDLQRLNQEAEQAYHHSDYPTALQKWEQGLKLARQLEHQQAISVFIGNLGVVYSQVAPFHYRRRCVTAQKDAPNAPYLG